MAKTTESSSKYNHLEQMSTLDLLTNINHEDATVPLAVAKVIPQIERSVDAIVSCIQQGGRLFYIGAGTSGRLGIVDASECPPTFGVPHGLINGIIAGGDTAIRKAVEFAEDSNEQGWLDLQAHAITNIDMVIGIAASGSTPYVIGAVKKCKENGIVTGCIVCNAESELARNVLNMLSTCSMIKTGRVRGNKMVDMQLSNNKLVDRGVKMIMDETHTDYDTAEALLKQYGSVRKAVDAYQK